jgi:hypothetical protein
MFHGVLGVVSLWKFKKNSDIIFNLLRGGQYLVEIQEDKWARTKCINQV